MTFERAYRMHSHTGRVGFFTAVLAATVALASCSSANAPTSPHPLLSNAGFSLVTPGTLIVATSASAALPAMTVSGATIGGVDGALINAFARDHHLKLRLYPTSTVASMILAVQSGKADLGTDYLSTSGRPASVSLTYPFFWERAAVFTEPGFTYIGPSSLAGGAVGTVAGSLWAPYLQKVLKSGAALFSSADAAANALIAGQIIGYVNYSDREELPPINNSPNVIPQLLLPGQYGMPSSVLNALSYNFVRCGNTAMAQALDGEMATLRRGSPSPWDAILTSNGLPQNVNPALQTPPQGCP